jgi:hypothetical protein
MNNLRPSQLHRESQSFQHVKSFQFAMVGWGGKGRPDLVAIKKSFTGTNSTDVHIFAGLVRSLGVWWPSMVGLGSSACIRKP